MISHFILLITLCLTSVLCADPAELIRKIEPLSVRGVNYFPQNTPWNKMWTETPTEVWERDMAAAAKLGVKRSMRGESSSEHHWDLPPHSETRAFRAATPSSTRGPGIFSRGKFTGYPVMPGESSWKSRQLREAVSPDGLSWEKLGFIPPDEDSDACQVPQALVTTVDCRQWL